MNKLSLNVKKTKAMLFHMPQKKIIIPTIKINGTLIEFVDNFNFLGINLNKHLNWNPHVTNVSNKLVKTVGVLNILKKTLPLNILRIIYNALILPHLNYGILAWGHLAKRLNLIQKRAVRILTASKYNSHTEPLFKQTHRCQPSRNRAGNPANLVVSRIPAFFPKHPAFLGFFGEKKIAEIHNNFCSQKDILC